MKCIENSMENVHSDVRVQRANKHAVCYCQRYKLVSLSLVLLKRLCIFFSKSLISIIIL